MKLISSSRAVAWPALAALVVAAFPLLASAQNDSLPLSLAEAERLALRGQPALAAFERSADAAREAAVAERQLPDPKLRAGIINLPATTNDAFRFYRDDQTMAAVGIAQDMVRADKREAAALRLEAEADASLAERDADERRIRRDVALAWLDARAAQQRRELLARMNAEFAAERTLLIARMPAGSADARELLALDGATALVEDQRQMALRDERRAHAMLVRWIGPAGARPLDGQLPAADLDVQVLAARMRGVSTVDEHPELTAARAMVTVARRDVERAQLESQRDWSWEVTYGFRAGGRSDMLTVQVAVPLYWDMPNRQDRRTAEKLALADRATLRAQDRTRQFEADAQAALIDYDSIVERESVHAQRLLPAADARLEATLAQYQAGRIAYSAVAEARRNALDARLQHVAMTTELAKAAAALRYFN